MTRKTVSCLIFLSAVSCISEQVGPKIDCTLSPVEISVSENNSAQCGASDGSFKIVASGGEPPYAFSSGAGSNTDGVFINVAAGSYTVVATDAKGCSDEVNVTIQNRDGVNLNEIIAGQAGCGSNSGSIQVLASGGQQPYAFSLNGGANQAGSVFSGLGRGTYTIKIKDLTGCEISRGVEILSGISYESSIRTIIQNSCAISGCHGGSISPDLRTFAAIKSNAARIKARTGNRSMPSGSTLTQSQIDMIACWVDDGAPQN